MNENVRSDEFADESEGNSPAVTGTDSNKSETSDLPPASSNDISVPLIDVTAGGGNVAVDDIPVEALPELASPIGDRDRTMSEDSGDTLVQESAANESVEMSGPRNSATEPAVEELPPGDSEPVEIPLAGNTLGDAIRLESHQGRITLIARNAPLKEVLSLLAQKEGLNLVCAEDVIANVSITLPNASLRDALTAIVSTGGCTWAEQNGIVYVTSVATTTKLAPEVQDRQVRVFHLDYVTGAALDEAVKGMLSSTGTSYVIAADPTDNRKTQETLVVEDMPGFVRRVEQYVRQVDVPPRQVQIEVHVLEVDLKDDLRNGVNFKDVMNAAGGEFHLDMLGFANTAATQGMMLRLNGADITGLVELLRTTTDAKTLASPKVVVVSGQESKIQVGQQLGFSVIQQTQTSTIQDVQFLDVGVVLTVTPRVGSDNRVLLKVKPEVSTGAINPQTGLPEKGTSEVATDVLLDDGQGIVIGGLIQERDSNTQNKLPWLGELKYVGHLFQRRELAKRRTEVIFVLIPRVMPWGYCACDRDAHDIERATTPLLHGPLHRVPRPWEPRLPDPADNPTPAWPIVHPLATPEYPTAANAFAPTRAIPSGAMPYEGQVIPADSFPPTAARMPRLSRLPPVSSTRR
ncbi:MAG: hypothetical protein R3C99_15325 [Pirellulaceae bacterium]